MDKQCLHLYLAMFIKFILKGLQGEILLFLAIWLTICIHYN
jgi:hypothetical protein